MKRIYLCGPVTERKRHEATNRFATVREKIIRNSSDKPMLISDPMRFCPPDIDWHKAMRVCVGELVRCDGVALLHGWQKSAGAAIEIKLAQNLHIPIVYIEPPIDSLNLTELFTAAPETLRYYNACITKLHNEGAEESLAENRAVAELSNRYLDPYGFEYIEIEEGEL
jgi:hypothetical protein